MTEPTALGGHLGRGETTPAEYRARADEHLRAIEEHDGLPAWCWRPMTETLAVLSALPDDLAWVAPAYLAMVRRRGESMFDRRAEQMLLDPGPAETLPCRCGADAPADPFRWRDGRRVRTAKCERCGLELVSFDEALYDRPTLISRAGV